MPGVDAGQQVDEGPDGDPQGCPGAGLPPLAYDLVVVAEGGGGFTVPGVQRGQGDFGEPGDQAAARRLGELDGPLQVLPGLARIGGGGDLAQDGQDQRQRGGCAGSDGCVPALAHAAVRLGGVVGVGQGDAGTAGVDNAIAERYEHGIGAEIMGAGKFGPPGWQDDPEWRGWWGDNPPFHTPTYVLTHHPRPSLEMEGGTTFHFLDAAPADALEVAREAAAGQDVRIGGGPTMMRAFIAAGLVDHLHVVQVPILLGRGVRLWDGLEALEQQYDVEAVSTPSGVTHFTFIR